MFSHDSSFYLAAAIVGLSVSEGQWEGGGDETHLMDSKDSERLIPLQDGEMEKHEVLQDNVCTRCFLKLV